MWPYILRKILYHFFEDFIRVKKIGKIKSRDSFWNFANTLRVKKLKNFVRLSCPSYRLPFIHKCHPTTAMCRNFCLLRFRPGPVRSLLSNLVTENFFSMTMLTQCLDWTLIPHKEVVYTWSWTQVVRKPSLQVAGLQVHATTLSWWFRYKMWILFCENLQPPIKL